MKCDLLNDKVINDKIINSKVINDKVINNKAISNEAINNKVLNNKAINNNAINDKIINDEIINNNAINNSRINSKVMTDTIINENKLIKKQENKNEIITKNEKREIEEEIEKEYNKNLMQNKILNKKIINLFRKEKTNNNCKIIIVSGIAGVGKSILTVNIAKALEKQKRKVLIIDFDFLNNSIQTLFGIKIKNKREINNINSFEYINDFNNIFNNINNIENLNKIKNIDNNKNINNIEQYNTQPKINWEKLIIKINSKIKLISNINSLFTENQIDDLQLLKIINEIKTKYDFIILDIENNNCLKSLAEECDKIIFITEPNILQIKKSKKLLEKYINEFKIEKEKLYILFNKVKNDSLSFNILKDIFKNYNIIGKINFIKNYNVLINQNMNSIFLENKIKKQYKKISKKLSQNNKIKKYYIDKIENL